MPQVNVTRQGLLAQIATLNEQIYQLSTAAQERDIVVEECTKRGETIEQQRGLINRLENERDYARMELNRAATQAEEAVKLRKQVASIMAICAIPREELLPQSKLAWITGIDQVPYSAAVHGGNPESMITSKKRWNMAIGGSETNTNALNDALKPLEAAGAVTQTLVECPDGLRHYAVTFDESMTRFPQQFVKDGEPNKHNGGDKRCPQCGKYCKKRITVMYSCEECGIDYDGSMKVIEYATPAPVAAPTQAAPVPPTPIRPIQPELKVEPMPMYLRRPIACHCGRRSQWIQSPGGATHCVDCEIEYRGRAS